MALTKNFNLATVLKDYTLITVGMLMYVIAWTVFLIPNNLVGGGVSGFSAMLQYATQGLLKSGSSLRHAFAQGKRFG